MPEALPRASLALLLALALMLGWEARESLQAASALVDWVLAALLAVTICLLLAVIRKGRRRDGHLAETIRQLETELERNRTTQQELERLRSIVEHSPDYIALATLDARLLYMNRGGRRLLGYGDDEDLTGLTADRVHPARVMEAAFREHVPHAMEHGHWQGESALLTRDGREIPVAQVGIVHRDAAGRVDYLSTICRDITAETRAAAAQAESEQRYRLMFNQNPLPTWIWEKATMRILDVNEAAIRNYGYSRSEFLAMTLRDFRPPEDVERLEGTLPGLSGFASGTWRHRRKDGTVMDVLIRSSDFNHGSTEARIAVALDLTDLLRAEREKNLAWSTLDALYATAPVGLGLVDTDLRYQRINDHLAAINGRPASDHMGKRPRDMLPDIGTEVEEHFLQVIRTGQAKLGVETSGTTVGQPGIRRHWLTGYYPIFHGGAVSGAGVVVTEITERKQAEQTLRDSQERLQAVSRQTLHLQEEERRALARELHDEVGQQLAALKFNLAALRRGGAERGREVQVDDSLDIVNAVLTLIRDTALELRPSMLDDLGLAAALDWYCRRQAARSGCQISLAVPAGFRRMDMDVETACFRIVQEAVNNALRHGAPGRIAVTLDQTEMLISLSVRDDGTGFDVPSALERSHWKSGLGLLGMRERAELLGGIFSVTSDAGAGTSIRAELPLPCADGPTHEAGSTNSSGG